MFNARSEKKMKKVKKSFSMGKSEKMRGYQNSMSSSRNSELPNVIQGHLNLLENSIPLETKLLLKRQRLNVGFIDRNSEQAYWPTLLLGILFWTYIPFAVIFIHFFNGFKDLWIRFCSFLKKYISSGSHSCYLPSTEDACLRS